MNGTPQLLETHDAGRTWKVLPAPFLFSTVCFSDANNGFASGGDGWVYRTGNGGQSWQASFSAPPDLLGMATGKKLTIAHVQCGSGGVAWASFSEGALRGSVADYHTLDGGATWLPIAVQNLPSLKAKGVSERALGAIVVVDPGVSFAFATCEQCGDNRVSINETLDGGRNWTNGAIVPSITDGADLFFADQLRGWIVGRRDAIDTNSTPPKLDDYPLILATRDGGQTWAQQYP